MPLIILVEFFKLLFDCFFELFFDLIDQFTLEAHLVDGVLKSPAKGRDLVN